MFNKRIAFMIMVGALLFGLSACNKEEAASAPEEAAVETVALPAADAPPTDWKKYLAAVVMQNMQGVKTSRPYMYFVPGGDGGKAILDRSNQLDNVSVTVSRGVLPGNMLAFGGPDSSITADLIIEAFENAGAGTFKDVTVLFVGAQADSDRVKEALASSGATYRFAEMK
ncbi:MAG TPA: hypothetical protein VFN25_14515 [Dokdonella sp.]|uniref:hypothetical protein n=1 Tax=Dokdonella sp. TaxID=2291710 RepID=UPI002D7E24AB|nr:hypothetical protein [Dokdonella sp.]HET9034104.1 hypothetical protein [Dokdonella sp.]